MISIEVSILSLSSLLLITNDEIALETAGYIAEITIAAQITHAIVIIDTDIALSLISSPASARSSAPTLLPLPPVLATRSVSEEIFQKCEDLLISAC